jgi:hypothetical protein
MDFDKFSWEIRPDGKVHLFAKSLNNFHWTLHPGTRSGVVDVHQTHVDTEGTEQHKTLFMIKLDDLNKALSDFGVVAIPGLFEQFRPLRLGWLRRRKIRIMRNPASTNEELTAVTRRNRSKRLELDMQKFEAALGELSSPDDPRMPDGMFDLMSFRRWGARRVGVGLKVTDCIGLIHLFWARPADILDWGQQAEESMREIFVKYGISPQDYQRYLSL